ncbi:MAG: SDR family NAD(P)-dependent oxidoreductase [Leptolyngbyaceae cyanobacterium]
MATYLITGANRGIGYEYCKQLHERGDTAISVCRTSSPELDALGIRIEADVDITDDASVAHLVKRLQGIALDVLINNAGIIHRITLDNLDFESIREQFEVNTLGALRLTRALLPNLKAGSKIILMTSRMGSIDDNTSGGSYGYRMSKRIFGNT